MLRLHPSPAHVRYGADRPGGSPVTLATTKSKSRSCALSGIVAGCSIVRVTGGLLPRVITGTALPCVTVHVNVVACQCIGLPASASGSHCTCRLNTQVVGAIGSAPAGAQVEKPIVPEIMPVA